MNDKKGFTLIEVLAVVVVLGIIGMIIVPKIVSTINNSKKSSYETSVNNLVNVLSSYAIDMKANLIPFEGCSYNFDSGVNTCSDLEYSGELPTSGSINVDKDGNVSGHVYYGDYEFVLGDYTPINSVFAFDYTGSEQSFRVSTDGYYKLEAWGAQGGDANESYLGGYGGYSTGVVRLSKSNVLYINVGGKGESSRTKELNEVSKGGYNGGGDAGSDGATFWTGGGGATHIALKSGVLSSLENNKESILIVAGGGGGAGWHWNGSGRNPNKGGSGGGYKGVNGIGNWYGIGGTQESGGNAAGIDSEGSSSYIISGSFGQGSMYYVLDNNYKSGGGGSGYYGGGSGYSGGSSAGGGSGYIGNSSLTDKYMSCYMCDQSNDLSVKTIRVNDEAMVTSEPISGNPKKGNGYVKITYLGESID